MVSQQAPLEITSEVGEILEVSFDVAFTGGEYMCIDTTASGAIKRVNASIVYTMSVILMDHFLIFVQAS